MSRRIIKIIAGSALLLLLLAAYVAFETGSVVVTRYTVEIEELPAAFEGFTILHLSDLHAKEYGEQQQDLVKLINRHKYDAVAVTGDFVDKKNPDVVPGRVLLQALKPRPTYFVPGNHEYVTGFEFKSELPGLDVKDLTNQADKIELDGEQIWFVGVGDPYLGQDDLDQARRSVESGAPEILLAHSPGIMDKAKKAGLDLTLVGHTHAGQIRLPFIGALYVPGQGYFPKYDHGLFEEGRTRTIISAGLGETLLPIRFNSRPEIVLVKLVRAG